MTQYASSGSRQALVIEWAALTLGAGMLFWAFSSSPAQMMDFRVMPGRYGTAVVLAALAAALLVAAGAWLDRRALAQRFACAAGVAYLAVFKALGFGLAPWLALGAVAVTGMAVRAVPRTSGSLLVLSLMGTLLSLNFALGAERWSAGVLRCVAMLASLFNLAPAP
jgi:hypothetical protein